MVSRVVGRVMSSASMGLPIVTIDFKGALVRKEPVRKYLKRELLGTSEQIRA